MNIEKGKISNLQLVFLIIAILEGMFYVLSFTANLSKQNTWLTVLSGLLIVLPFGYVYVLLIARFPGLNLAGIHNIVYGRYLGTMVSIYYLSYFLLIASLSIKDLGDFYNIFFMRETPLESILIVFTCVCAYASWNGIEVLARITPLILAVTSLFMIATTFMLLPKMDFSNFLPIGELPLSNLIHSIQIIVEIPFGLVFTVFLPIAFALNDRRQAGRTLLSGLLLGAAFFMVITIRNTAVLGNTEAILFSPSFQTSRLISIGFLSRLDILLAIGHTFGQFVLSSIYFYITVLFCSQMSGLRTYLPLIFPLGCIVIILGMISYPSVTAHFQSIQNVEIFFFFPAMFIFPSLTLLIAKIRNLPQKGSPEW